MTKEEQRAKWRAGWQRRRNKVLKDPVYIQRNREKCKRYYQFVKDDPLYRARQTRNQQRRSADPCARALINARMKARYALRKGRISKQACRECRSPKSETHHPDYGKPLDVVWLCRPCHRKTHNIAAKTLDNHRAFK